MTTVTSKFLQRCIARLLLQKLNKRVYNVVNGQRNFSFYTEITQASQQSLLHKCYGQQTYFIFLLKLDESVKLVTTQK